MASRRTLTVAALVWCAGEAVAQTLPPNFADQVVVAGWNQAVGVTFAPDGRAFVWEKGGKVWLVENGVKSAQPLIDITEEVANWGDYGLVGFAIDPNFYTNGYIYLAYEVDYHYLKYFGTPQYKPAMSTPFHDTIGRLTRYTCNAGDGFRSVDLGSRLILVGESITTGFPMLHDSHGVGTVGFGEDGSLLVGCGDGATYNQVDVGGKHPGSSNTALTDGIITATENVGAYRAQLVNSLSGKIVRIDPATGNGLPSNPYYTAAAPRSPKSRVWSLGHRNPFRWAIRPGTGNPSQSAADPGTLYMGDVGWDAHDRLAVAPAGGMNFGWPIYEGLEKHQGYVDKSPLNLDAPNPLAGGSCPAFFRFTDLLVPAVQGVPSWPNPCDPAQQIPASTPRYMVTPGVLEWGHTRTVRVPVFQGGVSVPVPIDGPQSNVQGFQFGGSCASGAAWYSGMAYPAAYRGSFFLGDYTGKFIVNMTFGPGENLQVVRPFASGVGGVVCIAYNPADQLLYYVNYDDSGTSALHRILWASNLPPTAVAEAAPLYGPTPLTVAFSSAGSSDPEHQPLAYRWDFGDGSPGSTLAAPIHVYQPAEDVTALGTFTAKILSLTPPMPTGGGSTDPEVIRDGVTPPVGSDDPNTQYATSHDGEQGDDDWIGFTFTSPHEIRWLVFQEGMEFLGYGGWFDLLNVEYQTGSTWAPVTGLVTDPAYPGQNGVNFETFRIGFDPVMATGIRLRGQPGGINNFISVGELRVMATPAAPSTAPAAFTARLVVTDSASNTASASVLISPNNTPPQVSITSPVNGSHYPVGPDLFVQMRANVTDAETPGQLTCRWQPIFHHDQHTHAEAPIADCAPDRMVPSGGCGAVYFWEFRLTVTDPQGLSTERSTFIYPECGCYANCDGSTAEPRLTANDFQCFLNKFAMGEEHYANCDGSTAPPVINANDFQCFLNRFAAGCS